jgi:hypothetical protein
MAIAPYGDDPSNENDDFGEIKFYKFNKCSHLWSEVQSITASESESFNAYDGANAYCSMDGKHAIVGYSYSYTNGPSSGKIEFYKQNECTGLWTLIDTKPGLNAYNRYGWSVSIYGDLAVAGSYSNEGQSGYIIIYKFDECTCKWNEIKRICDLNQDSSFGYSVSLSENYLLAGLPAVDNGNIVPTAKFYKIYKHASHSSLCTDIVKTGQICINNIPLVGPNGEGLDCVPVGCVYMQNYDGILRIKLEQLN